MVNRTQNWMWADALAMLARVDRLNQQGFQPRARASGRAPAWEPPVDVIETEDQLLILVALPGVDPDTVDASIEDGALVVSGQRQLPPELGTAVIHRLELPQGRFERRLALPAGRYDGVRRVSANGVLLISLHKA
jgi:HSP20 family molecular chaperone IbpA